MLFGNGFLAGKVEVWETWYADWILSLFKPCPPPEGLSKSSTGKPLKLEELRDFCPQKSIKKEKFGVMFYRRALK